MRPSLPGGADVILGSAGGDASTVFDSVHPQHAKLMAVQYLLGRSSWERRRGGLL
jgi:cytochrome b involved in lipid metabolism